MADRSPLARAEKRIIRCKAVLEAANAVYSGEAACKEYGEVALTQLQSALDDWLKASKTPPPSASSKAVVSY